tara:strand:- start:650 stop:1654 length:1005 start_codon:yes stop_codon:yes gene_type:complete
MSLKISKLDYYLPENIETNKILEDENPQWKLDRVTKKSGVSERHIALENETAYDLSLKACEKALKDYDKSKIQGIIYCTQSPDYIMPSNAFLLHKDLKLDDSVFAFDFNHACTGYIYSLVIANSFIKSSMADSILLVNADTYSKYINKKDRSTRVLFGDAAAVTLIESDKDAKGIIDYELASNGKNYDKFWIPSGGLRSPKTHETSNETEDHLGNIRSEEDISMDGLGVWSFINSVVPNQINNILDRNNISINKIDQIIFHQASLLTLESIIQSMKLDREKVFINIENVGNTVSSSIPIALKDAYDQGKVSSGSRIILSGFGVGLSYGTILMEL